MRRETAAIGTHQSWWRWRSEVRGRACHSKQGSRTDTRQRSRERSETLLSASAPSCRGASSFSHLQQRRNSGIRIQLWISQLDSLLMLLYEKDAGACEREITLTALALNRSISVQRDSPFLIASSSSFVASSRCEPHISKCGRSLYVT